MTPFVIIVVEHVPAGIKPEAAISDTDPGYAQMIGRGLRPGAAERPAAEAKADHVLIKSDQGYYRERGNGKTPEISKAFRYERGEAEKIIAEDRNGWVPSVRIEEIPQAKAADYFVLVNRLKRENAELRAANNR